MTPRDLLQEALQAVTSGRAGYGTPEVNHARTGALWGIYLGIPVSGKDVCILNILQKVSRHMADPCHDDNFVDIAGYAANAVVSQDVSEAAQEVIEALEVAREAGEERLAQEDADAQEDGLGEDHEPELADGQEEIDT
jgi:hypothetical protein